MLLSSESNALLKATRLQLKSDSDPMVFGPSFTVTPVTVPPVGSVPAKVKPNPVSVVIAPVSELLITTVVDVAETRSIFRFSN